jgi:hypothetical protein
MPLNLVYWTGNNGYFTTSFTGSFGVYPDSVVRTLATSPTSVYIGGDFSTSGSVPSQYAFVATWDGGTSSYNNSSYIVSCNTPVNFIYTDPNYSFVYTCEMGFPYRLFKNTTFLGNSPSTTQWTCVFYNGYNSANVWFAEAGSLFLLKYLFSTTIIDINLAANSAIVVYNGANYTTNIQLGQKGNSIELIWDTLSSKWYVVSINNATLT